MLGQYDPRWPQIVVLATFGAISATTQDFGTSVPQLVVSITAALLAQVALCRATARTFEPWSAIVTGLSLGLLLRSPHPAVWATAPLLGIAGKFLLRHRGKHLFNPACLAIVLLTCLPGLAWVSPGQWGSAIWLAGLVGCAGAIVLTRAARWDTASAFAAVYAALLLGRAAFLGDPLTIPLHQLQSGSLLIFAAFMVTDPRSTPDARTGRLLFAAAVAALGYTLQFHGQYRAGLFYALAACAPLTPLLDRLLPAMRFEWRNRTTPSITEALS